MNGVCFTSFKPITMPTTVTVDSPNLQDRSPRTIGQHSNKENDSELLFPPSENCHTRRGSFPLESLRETECNTHEEGGTQKRRLAKSHSFNEGVKQPTICLDGIPLGSLTAQEAAKSFWNMDMLHQRLQKITECAAQETSSLGSSLESFDLQTPEDSCIELKLDDETSVPRSAPSSPRLNPQLTYTRSHSAGHRLTSNLLSTRPRSAAAVVTPPFLSPGAMRRVGHSHPNLMVTGRRINLSPKSSDSSLSDDGYFD